MSTTLYRKYRPQRWEDIAGQNHVKVTLAYEVAADKIAHAYLFAGPRGIGKTTTARILAKAINCLKPAGKEGGRGPGEPCGECDSCQGIGEGRSLDVIEIDAASHRGIDSVRDNIIENARFSPSRLKYKVFIIDEVHMLTTEAFNALLKTLEEPPAHVLFVLATTELHKVPATIISRCQRFDFKKIPFQDLVERLHLIAKREGYKVEQKTIEEIARHADGSLRDAEGLLGKVLTVGEGKRVTHDQALMVLPRSDHALVASFVEGLLRGDARSALMTVSECLEEGIDVEHFADDVVELVRRVLLTKTSGDPDAVAPDYDEERNRQLVEFAELATVEELVRMIEILLMKRREIRTSHPAQLPLELAAVRLCHSRSMSEPALSEEVSVTRPVSTVSTGTKPGRKDTAAVKSGSDRSRPATVTESAEPVVSVDRLDSVWPEFMRSAGEHHHSLPFLLGVGKPVSVIGRIIKVGFGFAFHRKKFNEEKNRRILEQVLGGILQEEVRLEGVVLENAAEMGQTETAEGSPEGPAETGPSLAQNMAAAFEGRVVE